MPQYGGAAGFIQALKRKFDERKAAATGSTGDVAQPGAAQDLLPYPRPPGRDLNSSPEDLGRARSAALNSLTPGSLDNTDANAAVDLSDPILERRRRLRAMGGGSASYQSLFNQNGNMF